MRAHVDHIRTIRELLVSSSAHQVEQGIAVWDLGTGPWWKLFTDFQGLERLKEGLLAAAWALPTPLFFVPPTQELATELEPFLLRHDSGAWQVNRRRSPEDFYSVELDEGNWVIYSAVEPVLAQMPNTFKTAPRQLIAFLHEHGVALLIDAFYDDTEWRVALSGS
jgi:hypothetical protein